MLIAAFQDAFQNLILPLVGKGSNRFRYNGRISPDHERLTIHIKMEI